MFVKGDFPSGSNICTDVHYKQSLKVGILTQSDDSRAPVLTPTCFDREGSTTIHLTSHSLGISKTKNVVNLRENSSPLTLALSVIIIAR
jgi:hypothetical protein